MSRAVLYGPKVSFRRHLFRLLVSIHRLLARALLFQGKRKKSRIQNRRLALQAAPIHLNHTKTACTDSSELDGLMAETRGILTTVVASDGMAKYLDDENKAFGKSASWKKIHFRMQTILAIAQNANANK